MTDQNTAFIAAILSIFTNLRSRVFENNTKRCISAYEHDRLAYALDLYGNTAHEPRRTFTNTHERLDSELKVVEICDRTTDGIKALHGEVLKQWWLCGASPNDLKKEFNEFMHLV